MKTQRFPGFTLVELLVAMAITSVLIVLLGSVVSGALNVWQNGRNRLDTFSNARSVLGRISDEILGAKARAGQVQFVENFTIPGGAASVPEKSENIFFVAPYPNSNAGDLCVIAYRQDPLTLRLERAFLDSRAAWTPAAASRYKPNGYIFAANDWRLIANGVLEFEIQSYSQADFDAPPPRPSAVASWDSESLGGKTPRHIVLRLKIVDDKTGIALATLPPGAAYDRLVREKARDFYADVTLPAH